MRDRGKSEIVPAPVVTRGAAWGREQLCLPVRQLAGRGGPPGRLAQDSGSLWVLPEPRFMRAA